MTTTLKLFVQTRASKLDGVTIKNLFLYRGPIPNAPRIMTHITSRKRNIGYVRVKILVDLRAAKLPLKEAIILKALIQLLPYLKALWM